MTIAVTARVEPWVQLGDRSVVEDFAVLGVDPTGSAEPLSVGPDARIRSHTVLYAGSSIGQSFQTGHGVMVRESCSIGANVSIGTHTVVEHHVKLGDGVRIHSGAFIPEYTTIEDGAWIGPRVTMTNARYPTSRDAKLNLKGPSIGRRARIGANATLLPGIVIGAGALIGAGAVVTGDVPEGMVVVGNPARVIRGVREIEAYASDE